MKGLHQQKSQMCIEFYDPNDTNCMVGYILKIIGEEIEKQGMIMEGQKQDRQNVERKAGSTIVKMKKEECELP